MNSSSARRVAVRVLVHPEEQLRGLGAAQLAQPPSAVGQPGKPGLASFPYYCLPYHPLLCGPASLHHPGVQLPPPPPPPPGPADPRLELDKL